MITGLVFFAVLFATVRPLGIYLDDIFAGRKTFLSPILVPIERLVYRVCGIDARSEMSCPTYTFALLCAGKCFRTFASFLIEVRDCRQRLKNPGHDANIARAEVVGNCSR